MAATATQDDDLLIITDDTQDSDSDEIDFSFDFWDETQESTQEESIPEVEIQDTEKDENKTTETSETINLEDGSQEEAIDFGIDLTKDSNPEEEVSEIHEDVIEESNFDLWISDDNEIDLLGDADLWNEEESSSTGGWSTGDDGSMNDILSATIAKLAARKESIASDKVEKLKHEDEIKAQIQALENEHTSIEAELAGLDAESTKITANIAELEEMKLDPVKEHNAKRVVKKK